MNRLPSYVRQHLVGLRALLIFTVLLGIIYPVVMVGFSELVFPRQANGSLVSYHGRVVGSSLLCQEFVDAKGNPMPQYFQPRPSFAIVGWGLTTVKGKYAVSATGPDNYGCNPLYSSASNLGPNHPAQLQFVKQRQQEIAAFDHVPVSAIPSDAVTASASGLDPEISVANAGIQLDRVAEARHISPAQVEALVKQYTSGRSIGFLGQPGVNVLLLNRALDEHYPA